MMYIHIHILYDVYVLYIYIYVTHILYHVVGYGHIIGNQHVAIESTDLLRQMPQMPLGLPAPQVNPVELTCLRTDEGFHPGRMDVDMGKKYMENCNIPD